MEKKKSRSKSDIRGMRKTARRVFLDPSTPPASSIFRVVTITLVILVLAFLIIALLYQLSFLLFLVVISIFLAYLLDPLVRLIQRPFNNSNRRNLMPRSLAIVISYLLVFGVFAVAISYLAPQIAEQIQQFIENLPNYSKSFQETIDAVNNRYESLIAAEYQDQINKNIGDFVNGATVAITAFLGLFAVNLVLYSPWVLLIPILAFFFLKDVQMYRVLFLQIFPSGRWRARAESLLGDVNETLAAYARAQLISCVFIGTVCTIAFSLIGLDYALLLGVLAGVFEFIPLLGPLTISIIAVLVGAFSDNPWDALWVGGFMLTLRLTHDYVTYPRIIGDGIHLHPFAIILSVLAGEQVAGIPGVFLAIPIVAILTVLYKHVLEHSGREGLFTSIIHNIEKDETKVEVVETKENNDADSKEI